MFEVDEFFPGVVVFVEKFGKENGRVFATGEGEPANGEFLG